jgi:hypothetical protein
MSRDQAATMFHALFALLALVLISSFLGCEPPDAKIKEKRILSQINDLAESGDEDIRSEELRNALTHLNALRDDFPEQRDEIINEAAKARRFFLRGNEDSHRLLALFGELLTLPVSEEYANCVRAQQRQEEFLIIATQSSIEEMDHLMDRSLDGRDEFDLKVKGIREKNAAFDPERSQIDDYLGRNCRDPQRLKR